MSNYIYISKEELEALNNGLEVSCVMNHDVQKGETIYITAKLPEKVDNVDLTESDWDSAIQYLNMYIAEYASLGSVGQLALYNILVPLKKRYDSGERTKELYIEIMEVE